jgi:hypothetical protein
MPTEKVAQMLPFLWATTAFQKIPKLAQLFVCKNKQMGMLWPVNLIGFH